MVFNATFNNISVILWHLKLKKSQQKGNYNKNVNKELVLG